MLLLLAVIAVPIAVASIGGRFVGDRIYLQNNTKCRIAVMEEHDSHVAARGEAVLVKPGLIDRTPTMLIASEGNILFGGLHFADRRLQARGQDDIIIPEVWRRTTIVGSMLTYELTAKGELVVQAPSGISSKIPQPSGLPLRPRLGANSKECSG